MIRIYILEDDPSIIHNLTQIITGEKLGIICGDSADGMPSTAEILATRPDVIMLDFFMPQRDGIEVVTDLRAQGCTAKCIMLSQVSEKTLIGKAYSAGVDFFISKPINLLEVRGVIQNASRQVENERTLATSAVCSAIQAVHSLRLPATKPSACAGYKTCWVRWECPARRARPTF